MMFLQYKPDIYSQQAVVRDKYFIMSQLYESCETSSCGENNLAIESVLSELYKTAV